MSDPSPRFATLARTKRTASLARGTLAAPRWTRLRHFVLVAASFSVAKVVLYTLGTTLFLAREGPQQMPLFFVLLAATAIVVSCGFSVVVDRVPGMRLFRLTMLITLTLAVAMRALLAIDLPGIYFVVLASAHVYDIVTDIVFWVAAASYFTSFELRRATSSLHLALAAGGVVGGLLAGLLSQVVPAEDLLVALPPIALLVIVQLALAERRLQPIGGDDQLDDSGSPLDALMLLPALVRRNPLILLLALNSLMLTVVYCAAEYLYLTVYTRHFPDETTMAAFLGALFALIQVLEFVLLYVVSRPLIERAGPLLRNLVFPSTSLVCLGGLAISPSLPTAIATQINAEALSNAIFEPVNNTNYGAVPYRFHGRVRTLADGIFYPGGMAVAGFMLMAIPEQPALAALTFVALVCAVLFQLVNLGIGLLYPPTLVRNLRSGVAHFADVASGVAAQVAIPAEQVRALLRQTDPDARAIGLDLAERLDPGLFLDELRELAPGADRPTRRRIAGLLARAPADRVPQLLDELLASGDLPSRLIALQTKLARGEVSARGGVEVLAGSPDRSVAALAKLIVAAPGEIAGASGPLAEILPWCHDAEVAAEVVDACAQARRADLGDLLIAAIEAAPHEQQRQGLAVLPAIVSTDHAGATALAIRFVHHSDPRLRAEAVGALGALADSPQALRALGHALGDRNRLVRHRAAAALARKGDRAIPIAARQLDASDPGVVEAAISTLGQIGSRRATQTLSALLAPLYRDGIRNLDWLSRVPRGPEHHAWLALGLTLQNHNRRIADMVLNVVAALGASREVTDLRLSLAAADRRTRANALEALLALPQRRLLHPVLPLLEAAYASEALSAGQPEAIRSDPAEVLSAAAQAADPWVRCGAAHTANALAAAQRPSTPGRDRSAAAPPDMLATEHDMDRVLFLKRVALFRSLPLDTLLAVSRVLERRQYLDRDTILEAGTSWDHFCIVESGAVDLLGDRGATERLSAPAYFGELVLADDRVGAPGIVAAGDCVLLRLHRIVFRDLSRDYPDMLMELCKLLARRLRHQESAAPGYSGLGQD